MGGRGEEGETEQVSRKMLGVQNGTRVEIRDEGGVIMAVQT